VKTEKIMPDGLERSESSNVRSPLRTLLDDPAAPKRIE
jgi:hypothetical protein